MAIKYVYQRLPLRDAPIFTITGIFWYEKYHLATLAPVQESYVVTICTRP
jgi:hypothetical protein